MDGAAQHRENTPSSLQVALRAQPLFVRELLAGGLAGGVAKTCVAPLERTKILFQTRRLPSKLGVAGILKHIWTTEGLAGLFRGNSASVLRIVPYAAIHFSVYEHYRRALVAALHPPPCPPEPHPAPVDSVEGVRAVAGASSVEASPAAALVHDAKARAQPGGREVHPVLDLMTGAAAGATAVVLTYPLDLVRTRMAWATEPGPPLVQAQPGTTGGPLRPLLPLNPVSHPGVGAMLFRVGREEGARGLYRGCTPTLLGILPYAGLKFYVYQWLKRHYRRSEAGAEVPPGGRLPVHVSLAAGGAAGLVAQTLTYPLDVVRRQMQVEGLAGAKAPSMRDTVRTIMAQEGLHGFLRGLSINWIKVVPTTAVGFTVYEAAKSYLGVQHGSL